MAKYGLRFDLVETPRDIRRLEAFLLGNVGDYATERHVRWVQETCLPGIEDGSRRALAWYEHGRMVGDAVLKIAKPGVVELKNYRIAPGKEGKALGRVMMAHINPEAQDLLSDFKAHPTEALPARVRLDTGLAMSPYFEQFGFELVDVCDLYEPGKPEAIMERDIVLA